MPKVGDRQYGYVFCHDGQWRLASVEVQRREERLREVAERRKRIAQMERDLGLPVTSWDYEPG